MTDSMVRHCIAKAGLHYYRTAINRGQYLFKPGDDIFVVAEEVPRLVKQNKIKLLEQEPPIEMQIVADVGDLFPRKSNKIWVLGDGPTVMMTKSRIHKEAITFAVNHCFFDKKKDGTPALGIVPDYYVALDDGMMVAEAKRIEALSSIRKFTKRGNAKSGKFSWKDLRFFDVLGETGFSTDPGVVYHGKTSCYCALQLATQCGLAYYRSKDIEIHLAGIDLAVLTKENGEIESHHYGKAGYDQCIFTRMLAAIRYGLHHLNELGIKWVNHSPLLAGRIEDLAKWT